MERQIYDGPVRQLITATGAVTGRPGFCLALMKRVQNGVQKRVRASTYRIGSRVRLTQQGNMRPARRTAGRWRGLSSRHITHCIYLPLTFEESVTHTERSYVSTSDIERLPSGEAPTSRPPPQTPKSYSSFCIVPNPSHSLARKCDQTPYMSRCCCVRKCASAAHLWFCTTLRSFVAPSRDDHTVRLFLILAPYYILI